MCRTGSPFDIQTSTHLHVIGLSVIAPPSALLPSSILPQPCSLMRFPSRKEMFGANYQNITPIFQFLKLLNSDCTLMFAAIVHN